jgi:hypothetical protein
MSKRGSGEFEFERELWGWVLGVDLAIIIVCSVVMLLCYKVYMKGPPPQAEPEALPPAVYNPGQPVMAPQAYTMTYAVPQQQWQQVPPNGVAPAPTAAVY